MSKLTAILSSPPCPAPLRKNRRILSSDPTQAPATLAQPRRHASRHQFTPLNTGLHLATLFVLFIIHFDLLPLSDTFSADARLVVFLADDFLWSSINESESWSYLRAAAFFRFFSPLSPWNVALAVGILYVIGTLRLAETPWATALTALLLAPAIVLSLPYPQKDTISCLIIIVLLLILRQHHRFTSALLLFAAGYAFITVYVRAYYILIFVLAMGIYFFSRGTIVTRLFLVNFLFLLFLIVGSGLAGDAYLFPQQNRDFVNLHRLLTEGSGTRTAFSNPLPPDSFFNFLLNYIYAFIYLNFPIFFWLDVKALTMSIYVIFLFALAILNIQTKVPYFQLFGSFTLAHIMVLCLFDPDLGSYLRHLSTISAYNAPIIARLIRT